MSENIALVFFIFYGGEEYEEATYGGMVVMKMNKIKKLLILLTSVEFYF